jgi:competence protein ComEC
MLAAASAWTATQLGRLGWWLPGSLMAGGLLLVGRRSLAVVAAVGLLSGLGAQRPPPPAAGPVTGWAAVTSDPTSSGIPVRMGSHRLLLVGAGGLFEPGDRIYVAGRVEPARIRSGRLEMDGRLHGAVIRHLPPANPLVGVANGLRRVALNRVAPDRGPGRALLAGFLVGEIRDLAPDRLSDMRRAGLSHFVAVSGSNVATFLGMWWLLLGWVRGARLRWASGLVVLVVFASITRWEPSVVRASAMAGLVLLGRLGGVVVDGWSALGLGVAGSLLLAPELGDDVGFVLSVTATIGVMAGDRWGWGPRALRVGLGAQIGVAPALLAVFGSIPLLSPIANLVAAPLVGVATWLGLAGVVTGIDPVVGAAAAMAHTVLLVARVSAPWPQVGWEIYLLLLAVLVWTRINGRVALPAVLGGAALVVIAIWPRAGVPPRPAVVFLDVGQGDSALVLDHGLTMLIDGGPDPATIRAKLAAYGVTTIDVAVASHVHADHLTGLTSLLGEMPVGSIWQAFAPHETDASRALLAAARETGVVVATPPVGTRITGASVVVEVLGPVRRYAHPNDQSLVLVVQVGDIRVLFPGDVETFAQADLGRLDVDVLKVPHQGAATSDESWLAANAGRLAVVSVGPNSYGHPSPRVLEVLAEAGAALWRTDLDGDLVLHLTG